MDKNFKIDKLFKLELFKVVENIIMKAMETYNEKWVTGKQLSESFACFGQQWLKDYGSSLPRTHAVVVDKFGNKHEGPWVYPLHKIQRMVMNGEIKKLTVPTEAA